jgi:hypothetical protein
MEMAKDQLNVGDPVTFRRKDILGTAGIISRPVTEEKPGHALIIRDGYIVGVEASLEDIVPAEVGSQGFAQLAYNLIKLGSHVIEKRLL